ncbi:DUF362 domain-containing protein [Candidatus Poribacteria bacterium]|nr:DUF362 domain-containing protein [Candidatus Poribacteria bacterium]
MSNQVKVSIEKAGEDLNVMVAKAMQDADCENVILPGDSVLIKPNLSGCSIKGSTSVPVIKAIAQWAYDRGASKVVVGEGPVRMDRERLNKYFADIGIVEATKEVGASFVNFDDYEHVIYKNVSEYLPEEIGISKFLIENYLISFDQPFLSKRKGCHEMDKIINVPMLKVHPSTVVTFCMKNLKGCMRGEDKIKFHRLDLQKAIVELNKLVKPSINFIDGTKAMQGTDHNNGDIVDLGLVFCSKDIVAVDSVASYCIGIKPDSIRLIKLGKEEGIGESNLNNMEITGVSLEENRVKFELPEEAMSKRFPNLRILKKGACSACTANFMDGLAFFVSARKTDTIVMGHDVPDRNDAVLIGDCTKEYWNDYFHAPGCPPTAIEIGRALSRNI